MLKTCDIEDDQILDIWCPNCGLKHDQYLTDDFYDLANKVIENMVNESLTDFMKDLEKSFKNNKNIKFKANKKSKQKAEVPVGRDVGDFEKLYYNCCERYGKISSLRKFVGGYCPFCGEIIDGN